MHQSHAIVIHPDDNIEYGRCSPGAAQPDTRERGMDAPDAIAGDPPVNPHVLQRCKAVLLMDSVIGLLTASAGLVSGVVVLIAVLVGLASIIKGSSACCRAYILLRGAALFIYAAGSIPALVELYSVPMLWIMSAVLVAHSSLAIHSFVRLDKEMVPS